MSFTQWNPSEEQVRPGIYFNFEKAAEAQTLGGARGTVAIPLTKFGASATAKEIYTVKNEVEAATKFGKSNIQAIKLAFEGGAKDVLVYAMPTIDGSLITEDAAYGEAREALEAYQFNVFVFDGEVSATEQASTKTWLSRNRNEKKHFTFVAGGSAADDKDPSVGDARSATLKDDYIVNVISGAVVGADELTSSQYAAYVAGLVAGTPINKSITYSTVNADDVSKRLRNVEVETALKAGSLVLIHDGEKVKVEQGIVTSGEKLRKVRARQAIATDIEKMVRDNYIGKVDNNAAGQATLVSAIKLYLETLANENVLEKPAVAINGSRPSVGDKVYVDIAYTELDSMERIFTTINAD
ncbi:tail sheath protein [Sporosarcina phage Lietuvens]|nr:tail sheath protein [Sporosarcina phage Lietuvens]